MNNPFRIITSLGMMSGIFKRRKPFCKLAVALVIMVSLLFLAGCPNIIEHFIKPSRRPPLVEFSDGVNVFILEPPIGADLLLEQGRSQPLVEYADTGWSGSLSPPSGLLKEGGENQ